jgi:hypothetical protein
VGSSGREVPAVVLEILGEVLVGPAVLGWVHLDGAVRVTPDLGLVSCCLWPATRSTCGGSTAGSFGSPGGLSLCPRCWLCWSAYGLQLGGQVKDGLLAGITLMATPPGVLVPILNDADQTETPFGRLILAAGSLAELAPLVLLSVFFSASSTNPPVELGLRAGFVGLTAVVVGSPADQGMGSVARGTAAAGGHQLPAAVRLTITIALAISVAAEHFGPAAAAVSPVMPARYRLPFLALARPLRAPGWWSTGVRLAQEARYAPAGNRVMSAPVSARASWAARPQPGIDSACCSCSSNGASSRSITLVGWSMSAVSRSMRASIFASSAACSAVKNSAPSSASSSSAILRRRGAGQLRQHLGVVLAGDQVVHDVLAGHSVQVGDHTDSLSAADSSSFSARCFSRVRSSVRSRRYRMCSRITRHSGMATKQEVTAAQKSAQPATANQPDPAPGARAGS